MGNAVGISADGEDADERRDESRGGGGEGRRGRGTLPTWPQRFVSADRYYYPDSDSAKRSHFTDPVDGFGQSPYECWCNRRGHSAGLHHLVPAYRELDVTSPEHPTTLLMTRYPKLLGYENIAKSIRESRAVEATATERPSEEDEPVPVLNIDSINTIAAWKVIMNHLPDELLATLSLVCRTLYLLVTPKVCSLTSLSTHIDFSLVYHHPSH